MRGPRRRRKVAPRVKVRLTASKGRNGDLFCPSSDLVGPRVRLANSGPLSFSGFEFADGLVYATAVALGFASFENVLYLPHVAWPVRLARAAATPLAHSVFAAIWGLGWARGKFESGTRLGRFLWPLRTLIAAAIVHAAYDLAILACGAALVAGVLVFSIWAWIVMRAKRLVPDLGLRRERLDHKPPDRKPPDRKPPDPPNDVRDPRP